MIIIVKQKIHNSEDKLVKCLAGIYGQVFLYYLWALYSENNEDFIPLPCMRIKHEEPTEIITSDFRAFYMDFAYEMVDGSITHFEHFSGILTESKLAHTGAYVFEKYSKGLKKVNTIIVSTGDPEKSKREVWAGEIVKFSPIWLIFLREYDGIEKLKNIESKVKSKKELTLFDAIDLVFMVYFIQDKTPEEVLEEVCCLVSEISNPTLDQRRILRWGLTVIIYRFVEDPERIKRLKGMVKMRDETIHDTMRRILEDERQEAVEEAREGIRQEAAEEAVEERNMKIANDMIKEGLPINLIAKISKLDLNLVKQLQLGK